MCEQRASPPTMPPQRLAQRASGGLDVRGGARDSPRESWGFFPGTARRDFDTERGRCANSGHRPHDAAPAP
jgi:hypothetical protein